MSLKIAASNDEESHLRNAPIDHAWQVERGATTRNIPDDRISNSGLRHRCPLYPYRRPHRKLQPQPRHSCPRFLESGNPRRATREGPPREPGRERCRRQERDLEGLLEEGSLRRYT